MKNHNGLKLAQEIRRICCRAAEEGKTHVRRATLRTIDKQIRQLRKSAHKVQQPDLFSTQSM